MSHRPSFEPPRARGSIAAWRPFLIGVGLGLAFVLVVGIAVAHPG